MGEGPFQSPPESCLSVRLGTEGNFVGAISHDRDVWCDATPVKQMASGVSMAVSNGSFVEDEPLKENQTSKLLNSTF